MKKFMMGLHLTVACQSGAVEISGVAKTPGNPAAFVSFVLRSTARCYNQKQSKCSAAGEVLANVSYIDFSRSDLEVITLDALDSLSMLNVLKHMARSWT